MQIRAARAEDFPAVQAIIAKFPEHLMQEHLPEPEEFFVAEENEKIVGCCALEIYSQRMAEIRSLAVLPEFQNRGIGGTLVEACLSAAKEKNIYEVLTITGSSGLFEKHGFASFKNERYALLKILD
ncbi:MAG: GNAT family N-acetyltransferase [Patescibacteria group bacterium]